MKNIFKVVMHIIIFIILLPALPFMFLAVGLDKLTNGDLFDINFNKK